MNKYDRFFNERIQTVHPSLSGLSRMKIHDSNESAWDDANGYAIKMLKREENLSATDRQRLSASSYDEHAGLDAKDWANQQGLDKLMGGDSDMKLPSLGAGGDESSGQGGRGSSGGGQNYSQDNQPEPGSEESEGEEGGETGDEADPDSPGYDGNPTSGYDEPGEGYNLASDPAARQNYNDLNDLRDEADKDEEEPGLNPEEAEGAKDATGLGEAEAATKAGTAGAGEGAAAGAIGAGGGGGAAAAAGTVGAAEAAETAVVAGEGLAAGWPLLLSIALAIIAFLAVMFLFQVIAAALPASNKDLTANTSGAPTVICLDPGHDADADGGGVNTGTTSPGGVSERSMNWSVAQSLKAELASRGYSVVLTKKKESDFVKNKDRVDICVAAGAAIDFRIHMDDPGAKAGPWQEVPGPSYTNVHTISLKYANSIQSSLIKSISGLPKSSTGDPKDGGVTNDTKRLLGSVEANAKSIPVTLMEMMPMDDTNVTWLNNTTNRAAFVKGIANGIQGVIPVTQGGGSGVTGQDIVKIAKQELALHVSGRPNKYTDGNSEAWCADFVSWVLKTSGHPFNGGASGGWRIAYVPDVKTWFVKNHEFFPNNGKNTPQPGDVVIHMSGSNHHVNIVISVSGSTITVIGGNQGDAVNERTENWHDSYIVGFGRRN